jgi:predicted  nucleic acid-binding Zn-ribbon protein
VADAGDPMIADLAASGVDAGRLEEALRPVLVAKRALAALDRQIADIDVERKRIVDDQERLRENMKALRGSSEERQLLQHYTRQLHEQESRLNDLQTQRERLVAERASAAANLSRAIESVSFEWTRR